MDVLVPHPLFRASVVGCYCLQVRIYDVGPQGQSQGRALAPHPGTVLDLCWTKVRIHVRFVFPLRLFVASSISPEERPAFGCVRVPVDAQRCWKGEFSIRESTELFFFSSRSRPFIGYRSILITIPLWFLRPFTFTSPSYISPVVPRVPPFA